MKKFLKEFLLRGLICASGGPIVLAIIYGILGANGTVEVFSPREVCMGILTITLLAFIAAGMTAIYQMEQLPLPIMILLHGGALYIAYILTYLINGWLHNSLVPILIFTGIFVAGYALIWLIIYSIEKAKTEVLNKKLKEKL
ncbi:MAG: DUF3021 domain-containing protein [Oscillospiraceae bacterium]|nr:DUF3021 domain-containing protein [Oscillospiraceae bacterium]